MKTKLIATWSTWVLLSEYHNFDPYKELDFSIDKGGGNSIDYEYTGDVPKRETEAQKFMKNYLETKEK